LHAAVRKDGETVAIDSRSMLVHRREIGAAYRTHLAYELSQLGFQIERGTGRGGRYFELAGVPAALIDRWSSRHHQVQAAIHARLAAKHTALEARVALGGPDAAAAAVSLQTLKRSGQLMPGEDRYLASHTRTRKTPVTDGDLDRGWYHDGRDHEFDTRATAQLHDGGPRPLQPATTLELLDRLTEFAATFTYREARAVALEANAGVTVEQALAALDQLQTAGELLLLADGRLTTTRHRHLERRTVATTHRLAGTRVTPLSDELIARQTLVLDAELQAQSAQLSGEQRRALEVGCADRPLVIIEGQAGTGKSTTLTAIARAHQATGRRVIVTSTAALAADRLATELKNAGVQAAACSTAALQARLNSGRLLLDERTTVIHDEAALASTREHHQLLNAVQTSGARVILIGDPRQSQAVGAGGLWQDLEHAARSNAAHVRLTRIVRAQDPADRRDQALFRTGHTERALHGYKGRGRVHLTTDQREAEDAALEAAHADRLAGKRTLIVAQTSNEHLDELNARAQAIRDQDGQLGAHHLPLTARPYRLRAGDEIQLRHQLNHPELGPVTNGTTATVLAVDPHHQHATLQLADGRTARFTRPQADEASVRLSYVQHPFPAQGHTSDTAHLIVAENATHEGCYVALTRARQNTHIHAPHPQPQGEQLTLDQPHDDPLTVLAEWMSRTEPEAASIRTPIAHEQHLYHQHAHEQHAENDARRQLEDARRQLADARQVITSDPQADRDHYRHALENIQHALDDLQAHQRHADRLHAQYDALGPFARRGQHGRDLKTQLAAATTTARLAGENLDQLRRQAAHHRQIIEAWEVAHPNAHDRLTAAERAFGRLVDQEARRRLQNPGQHLSRALGPQPETARRQRPAWDHAALQIERYRARYQIPPDDPRPLGPEPNPKNRRQQADHDTIAATLLTTANRLQRPGRAPIPPQPQPPHPHLGYPPLHRDHGPSLGL
jgi:hypothetical protein